MPIVPIRRKEPSGTLDFFVKRLKPDPKGLKDPAIAAHVSNDVIAAQVAQTPAAIGFTGHGNIGGGQTKRLQVYNDLIDEAAMSPDQAVFPIPQRCKMARIRSSRLVLSLHLIVVIESRGGPVP